MRRKDRRHLPGHRLSHLARFAKHPELPARGLDYGLTLEELTRRSSEFNPIDNLAPLAKAGVKILHIHGDKDDVVPTEANSLELARRYRELGDPPRSC